MQSVFRTLYSEDIEQTAYVWHDQVRLPSRDLQSTESEVYPLNMALWSK